MGVQIEKAGIPVAHITTMTPIALMVGSNRIIPGSGVIHPLGNVDLDPGDEKKIRRIMVEKALETLVTEISKQVLFPRPY
jgi:glycine reductase complex component B subunit gamma